MALIKARPLSEYTEGEQDFAGRAARRARRRYRKARRAERDRDKARELRQKASSLERGGKRGKKRKKKAGREEAPEPAAGPRRFPGGFPGRGPLSRGRGDGDEPEGAEPEPMEAEDELDPEEVFPEDEGEEELGRGPGRARTWGPLVGLGRNLRVQAAVGHRAAIIALRPGLFLVAEISEETTRTQIGLAPILAPLLLRSAGKALLRRPSDPPADPNAASPASTALVRQTGPVATPAANLGWADADDVAAALGCDLCDPADRRGRR